VTHANEKQSTKPVLCRLMHETPTTPHNIKSVIIQRSTTPEIHLFSILHEKFVRICIPYTKCPSLLHPFLILIIT